jgi:hypothetical protein
MGKHFFALDKNQCLTTDNNFKHLHNKYFDFCQDKIIRFLVPYFILFYIFFI